MRILVIGSGGREHALCWKIAASPLCDKLYCAPGNAGIAEVAERIAIAAEDADGLIAFAKAQAIDLVVIGPEAPLVAGLADRLEAAGIAAFGPSAAAAAIEGSKGFMKDLAASCGIPTARYLRTSDPEAAKAFAAALPPPIVVKADGLAAGKGVEICADRAAAIAAIEAMMIDGRFGDAGREIVVEEFLDGEELSFFALADGEFALPFASAQDHKRVGDGDRGPNTGGMGAYSPAPIATPALEARIMTEIVRPAIAGLKAMGRPFTGILFAGIMVTATGPKLIEFNCRFGDPECEALMLRLKSDLLPALLAARSGGLRHFDLRWSEESAICVVMAAKGYPENPQKGSLLRQLDRAAALPGVVLFHAGTETAGPGCWRATGGRVLAVSASAENLREAQRRAYAAIDVIDWPEGFCRRDIGWRALGRMG